MRLTRPDRSVIYRDSKDLSLLKRIRIGRLHGTAYSVIPEIGYLFTKRP